MKRPQEEGAILKPHGAALPVALVYPNVYRVGMANVGFQFPVPLPEFSNTVLC